MECSGKARRRRAGLQSKEEMECSSYCTLSNYFYISTGLANNLRLPPKYFSPTVLSWQTVVAADDGTIPHMYYTISIGCSFGIVRNHENRLPRTMIQVTQNS